ncbi:MAG TPA: sigma-70 family RNA polymerase sigma factor [Chitinophagaceae bacterium]|nr:sigma-70 family RNA polymerase sigma factor [Chitinophagaceae bacterium]
MEAEALYREAFPDVARIIHAMGGTLEETKDVFHDAFIIFLEKKDTVPMRSPKAYLIGTAKILWLHNKQRISATELPQEVEDHVEDDHLEEEERSVVDYLQMAGEKCMQLLKAFYYDNNSMQKIATRFGFSTTRSATVQKYKCLEKIRTAIKKNETYAH